MGYLAIVALGQGKRAGFAVVAGVALGLLLLGFAGAWGVSEVLSRNESAYQILRISGIAFMLYLVWDAWRQCWRATHNRKPLPARLHQQCAEPESGIVLSRRLAEIHRSSAAAVRADDCADAELCCDCDRHSLSDRRRRQRMSPIARECNKRTAGAPQSGDRAAGLHCLVCLRDGALIVLDAVDGCAVNAGDMLTNWSLRGAKRGGNPCFFAQSNA